MFNFVKKGRPAACGAFGLRLPADDRGALGLRDGSLFTGRRAAGQYEILTHQTPIQKLIDDPATDPEAQDAIGAGPGPPCISRPRNSNWSPDGSYLKYVDLHRPFVVWNVTVAPPLSLEPKTWWFPIVGSVSYIGYFSEAGARRRAAIWDKKGWDTYIGDVPAFSTLGWFHDPLLNTFIFESEADLADTIFHELTHRLLFIAGDTDFNEAFATHGGGGRRAALVPTRRAMPAPINITSRQGGRLSDF